MEVTERKLAEERLRETQKLESIGILAGGVAHDFNNLITVIMGRASLALQQRPTCEHSPAILSASERAAHLTRQLLAYAGKGQVAIAIVDISALVERSKQLLSVSVPKRVNLSYTLSENLPCLEADPSQIEQILMNLVINAGEAIPLKTDGRIDIVTSSCAVTPEMALLHSRTHEVKPGAYVCLEVRDNGTGMDEPTISRIFEPFFSTKFTGRGLGLAAVHGIVRSSNGFIDVRSLPDAGTSFRVYLPACEKHLPTQQTVDAARPRIVGSSGILVVDDEEMVRSLARTILETHGYEVMEAKDGKDALRVLGGAPLLPSIVLLDLAMPVMGGDELVPVLAREYPGLKIIICSGFPEEEARQGFPSESVAGFLQKPYTVTGLAEKIRQVADSAPAPN